MSDTSIIHELREIVTAPGGWLFLAAGILAVGAIVYAWVETDPPSIRIVSDEEREAEMLTRPLMSESDRDILAGYYPKMGPTGLSVETKRAAELKLIAGKDIRRAR